MEKNIFEKIALKRNEKGLSKADMSRACDITQTAYANIEKGLVNSISIDVAKNIANALNENFNELFEIQVTNETKNVITLIIENQQLKEENQKLKSELLHDKRKLVEFLSINNLLSDVAMGLYHNSEDYNKDRAEASEHWRNGDFLFNNMPYDKDDVKSVIDYILKNIKV